jgi:phosphoserine phosphatase
MIADMDSTIIENECIDELADAIGVGDVVSDITERAMRGELEFDSALKERVGLLAGMSDADLQQVYDDRIRLTPGARDLVQTLSANGVTCVLVSGGFTYFTSRVADEVGFAANHANQLDIADGKLTGRVVEPILGAEAKLHTMRRYMAEMGIGADQVMAIGDGANDIPMIEAAGCGVAFCPKPVTARAADHVIEKRDLREVLYLLGYTDADIVSDS